MKREDFEKRIVQFLNEEYPGHPFALRTGYLLSDLAGLVVGPSVKYLEDGFVHPKEPGVPENEKGFLGRNMPLLFPGSLLALGLIGMAGKKPLEVAAYATSSLALLILCVYNYAKMSEKDKGNASPVLNYIAQKMDAIPLPGTTIGRDVAKLAENAPRVALEVAIFTQIVRFLFALHEGQLDINNLPLEVAIAGNAMVLYHMVTQPKPLDQAGIAALKTDALSKFTKHFPEIGKPEISIAESDPMLLRQLDAREIAKQIAALTNAITARLIKNRFIRQEQREELAAEIYQSGIKEVRNFSNSLGAVGFMKPVPQIIATTYEGKILDISEPVVDLFKRLEVTRLKVRKDGCYLIEIAPDYLETAEKLASSAGIEMVKGPGKFLPKGKGIYMETREDGSCTWYMNEATKKLLETDVIDRLSGQHISRHLYRRNNVGLEENARQ